LKERSLRRLKREAPIELICFPEDAAAYVRAGGEISVSRANLSMLRWD
jgi:hypothetical protein